MKRLISPANDGGLPYVNSDFNDILQAEHIKSYAAHLNGINDRGFGVGGSYDRGIVLQGCLASLTGANQTTLNLTDSMVYIPGATGTGDFYEAHPSIAISNYVVGSNLLYIIPDPNPTIETRIFRSGASLGVISKKYFTIVTSSPANQPYIQFLNGKTNRGYKRVLKYALSQLGEIFTTSNISDFDGVGQGVGDMYGFQLCNGVNGSYDLRGRFVLGYNNNESVLPVDNTSKIDFSTGTQTYDSTDIKNYGAIGNYGGGVRDLNSNLTDGREYYGSHRLNIGQMPTHNHNGSTGQVVGDMNHTHEVTSGDTYNGSSVNVRTGRGFNNPSAMSSGFVNGGSLQHTHNIPSQGSSFNHETRAPYMVMAYYQKISV